MGNSELKSDLGRVISARNGRLCDKKKGKGWTADMKMRWRDRLDLYLGEIKRDETVEPLSSCVREMKSAGVDPSASADLVSLVVFTHGLTRR